MIHKYIFIYKYLKFSNFCLHFLKNSSDKISKSKMVYLTYHYTELKT